MIPDRIEQKTVVEAWLIKCIGKKKTGRVGGAKE